VNVPLATGVLVMAAGALFSRFSMDALPEFLRVVVAGFPLLPLLVFMFVVTLLLLVGIGVLPAVDKRTMQ